MTKVLVFGAFDGLHPGHIDFFKQAKKHGSYLTVSVGRDVNVLAIKKKQPLFSEKERLAMVKELALVDEALLGANKNYYQAIKKINPDVICLGYDQWASEEDVAKGLRLVGLADVKIFRLKPYKRQKAKSSVLKKKSVDF